MPSPFPGMNPYMEVRAAWAGVHLHMLANFAQQLAPQIRPRYRVHTERYLTIGEGFSKFRPDLRIHRSRFESSQIQPAPFRMTDATLVTENLPYVENADAPPHLEIVSEEGEVVTVIELLSFVNKEQECNDYLLKRYQLLKAGIHLLEIDLLRAGNRIPLAAAVETPYFCLRSWAHEWPKAQVWGVTWAVPCPVLPVPLRPDEPEVPMRLDPAIEQAYAVEFEGFVDYTTDPPGPLTPQWQQEIDTILREQGVR